MNIKMKHALLGLLLTLAFYPTYAIIKLPAFVSDNMVLQRDIKIPVWGWADANEKVTVQFKGKEYSTIAGSDGKWKLQLASAPAGGPYDLVIKGNSTGITVKNILVGDVWICSGQSNMQMDFGNLKTKYAAEIASSANDNIRIITISRGPATEAQDNCKSDGWKAVSPTSVVTFSAAAYFFAKELQGKYNIPIGLIATNYGGTPAEAWTSEAALKQFPQFNGGINLLKDTAQVNAKVRAAKQNIDNWHLKTRTEDKGYVDGKPVWADPAFGDSQWKSAAMPALWDDLGYAKTVGVMWFRRDIDVPEAMAGKDAVIELGAIDDEDETYVNGVKVGGFANRGMARKHKVPGKLIKAGKNSIAVKIINYDNVGGMVGGTPMRLVSGDNVVRLEGPWKYQLGWKAPARPGTYNVVSLPTALYNAMISPLIPYAIKGVIWYQGEANAGKAYEYRALFPAMIKDWRQRWGQGDFPFIFQQLVNFRAVKSDPSESDWAELREAQLFTLAEPNTGMSVGIDIGEAESIHPLNKKDIGLRMALQAEKLAYGEKKIVASGPLYKSMKVKDNKIILSFTNVGGGLQAANGGSLKQFAIAGDDKKFVWADAVIKGNIIEVSSDKITKPVAVRYAWADNPEGCNLYNKEGLPASPFRTDDWPGVTFGK
ncbi:sialate O-acetylesterase [Chitinophagaceae bacterium LWZ2-11]